MTNDHIVLESLGSRVDVDGSFGVVRFVGSLDGKPGKWYGIQWDDPKRGKNNGTFGGHQYFKVTVPGSGSFISITSSSIRFGRCIEDALSEKYDSSPISDSKISFGGNSSIVFETVGWDTIRKKQKIFKYIQEVGLSSMQISHSTSPHTLGQTFSAVKDLDLSRNLLTSWQRVADIAMGLPSLELLRLSFNRLSGIVNDCSSFDHIRVLVLMHSYMTGDDILHFLPWFQNLEELHIGENQISSFADSFDPHIKSKLPQSLQVLGIEHNQISSWDALSIFSDLPSLKVMNLLGNNISTIPESSKFQALEKLNISHNPLQSWKDIYNLNMFPSLTDIRLKEIALKIRYDRSDIRDVFVATLYKIKYLNGSFISDRDRVNAELWYLRTICAADLTTMDSETFADTHPNYGYLCETYGTPEAISVKKTSAALIDRLVLCKIKRKDSDSWVEKKFPGTIKVGVFKLTICKLLRCLVSNVQSVSAIIPSESGGEIQIHLDEDDKTLEQFGIVPPNVIFIKLETK